MQLGGDSSLFSISLSLLFVLFIFLLSLLCSFLHLSSSVALQRHSTLFLLCFISYMRHLPFKRVRSFQVSITFVCFFPIDSNYYNYHDYAPARVARYNLKTARLLSSSGRGVREDFRSLGA
uniref:Uncharacterized protein n=2 Tax=Hemiselmis andersenii TaxID=464988 RepID=A0A7S1E342_HEMAN